ncbi:MAG: NADH-quinone oxidoreductase subunit D [Actinomycetes bacterium]
MTTTPDDTTGTWPGTSSAEEVLDDTFEADLDDVDDVDDFDELSHDDYASAYETTEGKVYTVGGGDWDTIEAPAEGEQERLVVNMGPQHPSTHGVLRIILELDGETVTQTRCTIGYLHTGIEKNLEYRSWTQGTTFVTRMDYLSPFFNETAYCLGVERLLGITEQIPERASVLRVMMMELNRVSSHLVCLATGGMELGALTAMIFGFRERETILDLFEMITGLRMNHAYVRPGGLKEDIPEGSEQTIREQVALVRSRLKDTANLLVDNSIWMGRTVGVGYLDLTGCIAMGVTGPPLRATGLPHDLRKSQPYCGYETYEFNVATQTTCDVYGRFLIRLQELEESLNIVDQCLDRLRPGPVMVEDKRIAWPAQLSIGSDGQGNSLEHIRKIMGTSMESLIHHFKLVTEGFEVPAGQVYQAIESPRGELGAHIVSDGGTRPYRVHFRDPSFVNLQAVPAMTEGSFLSDVVAAVASVDPVMGGVDR